MKFVIATQELNFLISKCQSVVGARPTIPILANFLIEAKNDELVITSTDLTVGVRCYTEAKILEEGATTLNAKKFAELVRELTSVNLEFSTGQNEVTEIKADSSKFKLNGMNAAEFPALPDLDGGTQVTLPQSDLRKMLFSTSFAVSREDNRYALTGLFLQIENGVATFVGTDGKRLSRAKLPVSLDPGFSGSFVVPLKAVEEIQKNLKEDGDATLYLMQDKIAVEANQTILITKLLSGEYPDISGVIPKGSNTIVSLHREELMSLLRQVSLFTVGPTDSVRFSFQNGELKLNADTIDIGEGDVSMPVNYQGEKLDIAFNPNYFLDILRHTAGETVSMGMSDPFNPSMITEDVENPSSESSPLFVLMPMRLDRE